MERKIGEIFEYEGEWYQCVRNIKNVCKDCAFFNNTIKDNGKIVGPECYNVPVGSCGGYYRKDGTSICFKKLEKVGNPIRLYNDIDSLFQTYKLFVDAVIPKEFGRIYSMFPDNSYIKIELKQNQENMEEKKNEELSNLENTGKNLKPFDLEAARKGKPVCTRDGRKARIICFDKKCLDEQILIVLVDCGKEESIYFYTTDGKCIDDFSSFDLMMLPEKKEGWVNILRYSNDNYVDNIIYATEELAKKAATKKNGVKRIATVKISWEE